MPSFSGGGGSSVGPSTNLQVNSLGVGVAADGTAGDATINALTTCTGGVHLPNNVYLTGTTTGAAVKNIISLANDDNYYIGDTNQGETRTQNNLNLNTHAIKQVFHMQLNAQSLATYGSATGQTGTVIAVNDATAQTWGATVVGGSNLFVLAVSDGTNWVTFAK